MRAVATLLALLIVALLVGCGSAAAFPEPAACSTLAAPSATGGRQATSQYFTTVRTVVTRIATLRETLRNNYPGDKFSRDSQFRVDFAAYADSTVCGAQNLKDLRAPAANLAEFDAALDTALQDLIDHTLMGRTAVKARNVTDYRDWFQDVDLKIDAVKTASAQAGPR